MPNTFFKKKTKQNKTKQNKTKQNKTKTKTKTKQNKKTNQISVDKHWFSTNNTLTFRRRWSIFHYNVKWVLGRVAIYIHCSIDHCGVTNGEMISRVIIRSQCHCRTRIVIRYRWCPRHFSSCLTRVRDNVQCSRSTRYRRILRICNLKIKTRTRNKHIYTIFRI